MTHSCPIPLGRAGVWLGSIALRPWNEEAAVARELEELGYGAIWYSESHLTRESMSHGALLLGATDAVPVASGIANIWVRDATSMASAAASLQDAYPDRYLLGIGVSHALMLGRRGHDYRRPYSAMVEYLDRMDEPGTYGTCDPGRRVLGALAPRMLALSAERAAGAHPYLTTPEHTAWARGILGDGPLLLPMQAFVVEADPGEARAVARSFLRTYLRLENYRESWRRQGFSDEDFGEDGSDRLVDATIAWGDVDAVTARMQAHLDAGADQVVVQALGPDPVPQLRALAGTLL